MAEDEPPPDVLSSLPRTRPQRRSAKRDASAKTKAAPRTTAGNGAKATGAGAGKPRAAGGPKAAAKPRAAGGAKARAAGAPKIPPAGFAAPRTTEDRPVPSGVELVGTAIQAAGELAQIGITVGGQALRSALGRLGRS